MILKTSCLIFKKKTNNFSIFTFSKQSFLGIFYCCLKTPQNYKSCSNNGQNHEFAILSFTFHPLLDIGIFSRTFDMESPSD